MNLKTCPVCSTSFSMGRGTRNYEYENHCSRYCYEYDDRNLTKDDSWPEIPVNCQTCDQQFTLIKHKFYANSYFCSSDCYRAIETIKKGVRDYHYLLPLYKSGTWMSASEIAYENRFRHIDNRGATSISNILRLWKSRGILKIDKSCSPYLYLWNFSGPVGQAMLNYKKVV